jgi:hypothetical protein
MTGTIYFVERRPCYHSRLVPSESRSCHKFLRLRTDSCHCTESVRRIIRLLDVQEPWDLDVGERLLTFKLHAVISNP